MKKKKSFTLIELIIVIVIMGVLATITFDILGKVYKHYIYTKEINRLNNKLNGALEEISVLLRNRLRNSVIATKYPKKKDETDSIKVDFKAISQLTEYDTGYTVLEWIGKDYEARYGMWDANQNHIQTGWSGFIDLDKATRLYNNNYFSFSSKEYNVTTVDSNFTIVKLIDRNITAALGEDIDNFDNNITTLIFSGDDMGGDLNPDVKRSFGWYKNDNDRLAKSVFSIKILEENNNSVDLDIKAISRNDNATLYARYFLVRTAYSIVPIENNTSTTNDYNLTLYYNYQPWRKDWWNKLHGTENQEANNSLIVNHVTQFRFKQDESSSMFRIYLCIESSFVDMNSTNKLEVCKEKVVF